MRPADDAVERGLGGKRVVHGVGAILLVDRSVRKAMPPGTSRWGAVTGFTCTMEIPSNENVQGTSPASG
jgi:hypothetical protein